MFNNNHFVAIYAQSTSGIFGVNNTLPWKCKSDLAWFKGMTKGHAVIMGRKTFESLPNGALKDRVNVVVTTGDKKAITDKGAVAVGSLREAAVYLMHHHKNCIQYVIGGAELLRQALPYCTEIIVTTVDVKPEVKDGDHVVYAPELPDNAVLQKAFALGGIHRSNNDPSAIVRRYFVTGSIKSVL